MSRSVKRLWLVIRWVVSCLDIAEMVDWVLMKKPHTIPSFPHLTSLHWPGRSACHPIKSHHSVLVCQSSVPAIQSKATIQFLCVSHLIKSHHSLLVCQSSHFCSLGKNPIQLCVRIWNMCSCGWYVEIIRNHSPSLPLAPFGNAVVNLHKIGNAAVACKFRFAPIGMPGRVGLYCSHC